ncbi:unnamed protein product [Linum tenue]|uniref:Cytochrome P450 n=1 Tax=Linum tenue TaxID=586396 RepID=A0AAV0L6E0_9ROSI|nr:unnamed protein product [Linum tenue]
MEFPSPSDNLNTIFTALALAVVLALALYRHSHRRPPLKTSTTPPPPMAGGAWPVIGHLGLFTSQNILPHVALGSQADEHGPIFALHLGVHRAVVINSWELAKEVHTTHDVFVSERPNLTASKLLSYDMVMFGFAPNGPYWREMRKFLNLELQSPRWIELWRHVQDAEMTSLVRQVTDEGRHSGSSFVKVELKRLFRDMTMNMILRMVVGKRLFGCGSSVEEEEARRCRKALKEFSRYLGMFVMRDVVPFLGWMDVGGHEKAMKGVARDLDEFLDRWLEEHRRKRASGGGGGGSDDRDFMDAMLSVLDGANFAAGHDPDVVNKAACLNIIAAGSETTTVTLTWAISLLLNNTHVLQKAYEELDKCVGKQRPVNESDIPNLTYLQTIVKETLRLYPPSPLSGPRVFTEDRMVHGYRVRKGTQLITNIWKIQRDSHVWADPLEFRPERFLGRNEQLDFKAHQSFEFMPFGSGRRICPGMAFGMEMVNLVLAGFLHAFEIRRSGDELVDMTGRRGLTTVKASRLEILASPRLPREVYT